MSEPISRRTALKSMAGGCVVTLTGVEATPAEAGHPAPPDVVTGKKTGAAALVETLKAECVPCVFGIPGAQEKRAVGRDEAPAPALSAGDA